MSAESTAMPGCVDPAEVVSSSRGKKIVIGVCAMRRKATSKPMRAIMAKIVQYYKDWLEYFVFPEDVILNQPVEKWPLCDCLISFHSSEFPLYKAIEYVRLRRPYVINDLARQYDLLDRRKVFHTLAKHGIEHPRHGVVVRDGTGNEDDLIESADHIEVNGMIFNKPFVEKPISAEDHNVYIYYPSSVGGGSQRLFRKINNRSSWYSPISEVRKEGSYIYEDFVPADGVDVKVYAVGPYYAHAEARKAPGLDGKVERDADGKEVRYPVILSAREKMIARKVVLAFGQTVCGFDLLRANGKSYVCDVNGFSFVKTSTKYYEDTAKILGNTILRRLASTMAIPVSLSTLDDDLPPLLDLGLGDDPPLVSTPSGKLMELRCVLAVIRHGDRTPKQKMKVVVHDPRFFTLFEKYGGFAGKKNEIKMKRPNQLMEVLELARQLLLEKQEERNQLLKRLEQCEEDGLCSQQVETDLEKTENDVKKWDQMRTVLEMCVSDMVTVGPPNQSITTLNPAHSHDHFACSHRLLPLYDFMSSELISASPLSFPPPSLESNGEEMFIYDQVPMNGKQVVRSNSETSSDDDAIVGGVKRERPTLGPHGYATLVRKQSIHLSQSIIDQDQLLCNSVEGGVGGCCPELEQRGEHGKECPEIKSPEKMVLEDTVEQHKSIDNLAETEHEHWEGYDIELRMEVAAEEYGNRSCRAATSTDSGLAIPSLVMDD